MRFHFILGRCCNKQGSFITLGGVKPNFLIQTHGVNGTITRTEKRRVSDNCKLTKFKSGIRPCHSSATGGVFLQVENLGEVTNDWFREKWKWNCWVQGSFKRSDILGWMHGQERTVDHQKWYQGKGFGFLFDTIMHFSKCLSPKNS